MAVLSFGNNRARDAESPGSVEPWMILPQDCMQDTVSPSSCNVVYLQAH
jgi:hypothetical protein